MKKKKKLNREHPHLPRPGQLPPHSGWNRCYRQPTCTEHPMQTESPSAPVSTCKHTKHTGASKICAGPMSTNFWLQILTTYSSLGRDVSAAHHFSSGQGLFSLSSFPQSHESRHLYRATHQVQTLTVKTINANTITNPWLESPHYF